GCEPELGVPVHRSAPLIQSDRALTLRPFDVERIAHASAAQRFELERLRPARSSCKQTSRPAGRSPLERRVGRRNLHANRVRNFPRRTLRRRLRQRLHSVLLRVRTLARRAQGALTENLRGRKYCRWTTMKKLAPIGRGAQESRRRRRSWGF